MEEKHRPNRFTEVLGENVDNAFKQLASEILKDGALTLKEKSLIALACAVAVKCDPCTRHIRNRPLMPGPVRRKFWKLPPWPGWCVWVPGLTPPMLS
nr:carboxymuconolactone decarboxylase family protein [Methanobacterium formicicum]